MVTWYLADPWSSVSNSGKIEPSNTWTDFELVTYIVENQMSLLLCSNWGKEKHVALSQFYLFEQICASLKGHPVTSLSCKP